MWQCNDAAALGNLRAAQRDWCLLSSACSLAFRWRRLEYLAVKQQMLSYEFWALLVLFPLTMLAHQFYLGSARFQLNELGDDQDGYKRALVYFVPGAQLRKCYLSKPI